jgi:hypothetical protein
MHHLKHAATLAALTLIGALGIAGWLQHRHRTHTHDSIIQTNTQSETSPNLARCGFSSLMARGDSRSASYRP